MLGDQLNESHSWFSQAPDHADYLLIEARSEATYTRHHIQKIVGFFVAMRLFAERLKQLGFKVRYLTLDDQHNKGSIAETIAHLIEINGYKSFEYQAPDEYRLNESLTKLCQHLKIPTQRYTTEHFLVEPETFSDVFKGHKRYIMESFYRVVRTRYGFLMQDGKPEGDRWNFDSENRNKLPDNIKPPEPLTFKRNVSEIFEYIKKHKLPYIGELDPENFPWPVTRDEALKTLDHFCAELLPHFGSYQDAMRTDHPYLYHSRLSFSLNIKQISPNEVIEAAIKRYRKSAGKITLAQIEGFVRQIAGWREFMRGVYWTHMPKYKQLNALAAKRPLPHYFWDGQTKMNCLKHAIGQSLKNAYAHHIQRLMVTGNFTTLAGIDPDQVDEWYLGIYIDAIEWVQLPNTRGMSQFADGGIVGTKPYTSSAAYINKMSNYCKGCHYKMKERLGEQACPFNSLYWDFLIRNESILAKNPRIGMGYQLLAKMPKSEKSAIVKQAAEILDRIEEL
ncbi:MAG: cryptochrome/photolyase family protein [Pseudomonadota bacterium]